MDYRRFGNAWPQTLIHSPVTSLMPQLEDYDLFRNSVCDPYSPLEEFNIVLNVEFLTPLTITAVIFFKHNILQVRAVNVGTRLHNYFFSRDSVIQYKIPDNVNKENLVADWYMDGFLMIHEKTDCESVTGAETTVSKVETNSETGTQDSGSGLQSEDQKVVEFRFVQKNLKPTVRANDLLEFVDIANNARLGKECVLRSFFTSPNVTDAKKKIDLTPLRKILALAKLKQPTQD